MFSLKFKTSNAAFDNDFKEEEISRILTKIAEQVKNGYTDNVILDVNGNNIGSWKLTNR
jgi:predicted DNA-binding WGR domain protein